MAKLDVYREWLGIAEPARPLNHYQLLRLKKFEDDVALIRTHYRKLHAHVKKYQTGDFAQQSQDLLNELAKSMICLTDARRKEEYDITLGREAAADGKRQTCEQILLRRKVLTPEQLEKARKFAGAINVDVQDAVVQLKLASSDVAMQAYAESLGLPYIDLADTGVLEPICAKIPAVLARRHSCLPVMLDDDGALVMASTRPLDPTVEDEIRLRTTLQVRSVLCTPAAVNANMEQYFPKERLQAELATGAADRPAAKSTGAAGPEKSPEEIAEANKQRNMMSLMGFNFAFMATVFYTILIRKPPGTFMSSMSTAIPLGAIAAATVWIVMKLRFK